MSVFKWVTSEICTTLVALGCFLIVGMFASCSAKKPAVCLIMATENCIEMEKAKSGSVF